jgi:putative transport protein
MECGPIFISAMCEQGYVQFLGGIAVTLFLLLTGLFFGYYILKMFAGIAAVQEKSDTPVATLGYSCHGGVSLMTQPNPHE